MAHNLLSSFLSGTVLLSTKLVVVFLLLAAPPPPPIPICLGMSLYSTRERKEKCRKRGIQTIVTFPLAAKFAASLWRALHGYYLKTYRFHIEVKIEEDCFRRFLFFLSLLVLSITRIIRIRKDIFQKSFRSSSRTRISPTFMSYVETPSLLKHHLHFSSVSPSFSNVK